MSPTDPAVPGPDPELLGGAVRRSYFVADVEPLDVDGVGTVAVGTILWAVAFVLLLPFHGRLEDSGRTWWLWTCVAGFGLGMFGVNYCRRRRRRRPAAAVPTQN
jgi:hypothetical protein